MSSILDDEIRQFASHAGDWWDPNGSEAMLHKLNPVRLKFIREEIDRHWQVDECSRRPLNGKTALDVGCGAGLLAEPLARLGASVTAIDAAAELIVAAKDHAAATGLIIDYRAGELAMLPGTFDLITCLEVIEHVANPAEFVRQLAERLAPGGLLILSTPNATAWSRLLTITLAEGLGRIPRGTHDFDKFIAPEKLTALLAAAGFEVAHTRGIAFSPTRGLQLSDDLRLNYLVSAIRRESPTARA